MTEILLRVTVLLMAAMLVALALRRASAALRHLVWTLSLAGALLIPLCSFACPPGNGLFSRRGRRAAGNRQPMRKWLVGLRGRHHPTIALKAARNPASAVRFLATFHGNCAGRGPGNSAHGRGSSRRGPDSARVVLAGAAGRGLGGREFLRACLVGDRRRGGLVCCPAGQVGGRPELAFHHAATARPVRRPPADCRPRVPSGVGPDDLGAFSAGDSRSGRQRVVVGRGQAERAAARVRAYPPQRLPDVALGPAGLRGVLVPSAGLAGGQAVAEDERAGGRRPGAGLEHRTPRLCRASRGDCGPDAGFPPVSPRGPAHGQPFRSGGPRAGHPRSAAKPPQPESARPAMP